MTYPIPPNPTSATRLCVPGALNALDTRSMISSLPVKLSELGNGTRKWIFGL